VTERSERNERAAPETFQRTQQLSAAKRVLLRPFAGIAVRVAQSRLPAPVRLGAARLVALPYLCAADVAYERTVGQGRFAGSTTDLLQALVYVFGVWEPVLTSFITRRLSAGDVFIDVGANSGWYTTLAASRVGASGRVVAVEASPDLAAVLRAQVERNGFANVRIVEAAATDHVGVLHVVPGPAEHTGLTRVSHDGAGVEVKAAPLPDLLEGDEWSRARLVKIDVEGAEYAVVRGLAPALEHLSDRAEVVVEVGAWRATDPSEVANLFAAFADAGFHAYRLPNDYRVRAYVSPVVPEALKRLATGYAEDEVDVVFSRVDAEQLPMTPAF